MSTGVGTWRHWSLTLHVGRTSQSMRIFICLTWTSTRLVTNVPCMRCRQIYLCPIPFESNSSFIAVIDDTIEYTTFRWLSEVSWSPDMHQSMANTAPCPESQTLQNINGRLFGSEVRRQGLHCHHQNVTPIGAKHWGFQKTFKIVGHVNHKTNRVAPSTPKMRPLDPYSDRSFTVSAGDCCLVIHILYATWPGTIFGDENYRIKPFCYLGAPHWHTRSIYSPSALDSINTMVLAGQKWTHGLDARKIILSGLNIFTISRQFINSRWPRS